MSIEPLSPLPPFPAPTGSVSGGCSTSADPFALISCYCKTPPSPDTTTRGSGISSSHSQGGCRDLETQEPKAPGCIIASYPFQIRGDLVSSQTRCIGSLTRMSKSILSTSTLQTAQPPAKRERRCACLLASAEVPTPPHPQPPPQQLAQP